MSRTRPEDPRAVRIEAANEWAWCGAQRLRSTPRTCAVLRHLVEHQGRLITKNEGFVRRSTSALSRSDPTGAGGRN